MEAFLVQLLGNLAAGSADAVKLRNPPQQVFVVAQLLVPAHWTNQLVLTDKAAAPVHGHVYTFTFPLNVDYHSFDQVSNDGLPIHGRCLWVMPKGRQIR